MKFKIGDKVYLDSKSRYTPAASNPKHGSNFFCYGRVINFSGSTIIIVRWDNGYSNSYRLTDLIKYKSELDHNHPLTKIFK